MKYLSLTPKSTKLTFGYDLSKADSFDGERVVSNVGSSNTSLTIEQMGFDISESPSYSGKFIGDYSSVTGHFSEGSSSMGCNFDKKTYIEIKGDTSSKQSSGTFIFSYEKKSRGTEIIFSNYSDDPLNPEGFEVGINDANKLFFLCQSSNGEFVKVFNNIPYKKNIYWLSVNLESNQISMNWWDTHEEAFETEEFLIDSKYIKPSSLWKIGSGVYSGEEGLDFNSAGYPFEGYVDKFFHFDDNLNEEDVTLIVKSFYETLTYHGEESGQYSASLVTGFSPYVDEIVSGITGYEDVITGYTPLVYEDYQYVTGENLYGDIVSGDTYYQLFQDISGNGLISGDITGVYQELIADEPSYEITGFATGYQTASVLIGGGEPLYFYSGISGELYKTYKHTPLYKEGAYYKKSDAYYDLETGASPIIMPDGLDGYGPRSYTYLGARDASVDFIETQKGVNLLSVNNFAGIFSSDLSENPVIVFDEDLSYDIDSLSVVVNGLTKQRGQIDEFEEYFDLTEGEFCVYENIDNEDNIEKEILTSDANLSLHVDSPIIDILKKHDVESLVISDTSQYSSSPFSEINPNNKNIFLNGQKIYKDIDYEIIGDSFKPIGDILNITGVFHTTSDWHIDSDAILSENVTGLGLYDIHEASPTLSLSYVSYLNGVRLDPKAFVLHDKDVDLISQNVNYIAGKQYYEIYNNYDINRMVQDSASAGGVVTTGVDWALMGSTDTDGTVLNEYGLPAAPGTLPMDVDPEEVDQYEPLEE